MGNEGAASKGETKAGNGCAAHALPARARGNAFQPVRLAVAHRDGWRCQLCGRAIDPNARTPAADALHVDHRIARAHGGSDDPSNLRATCAGCNLAKGDRSPMGD